MSWRAAIGSFAGCSNINNTICLSDYLALNSIFSGKLDLRLLLIALAILLIIGEVEKNPGPPKVSLDDLHKLLISTNSGIDAMKVDIRDNSKTTKSIENKVSETNESLKAVTKDLIKAKSDISLIKSRMLSYRKLYIISTYNYGKITLFFTVFLI
jgi:hypothetical protein